MDSGYKSKSKPSFNSLLPNSTKKWVFIEYKLIANVKSIFKTCINESKGILKA